MKIKETLPFIDFKRQINRDGKKLVIEKPKVNDMDKYLDEALGHGDRDVANLERKTQIINPFITSERERLRIPGLKIFDAELTYESEEDQ